MIIANLAGDRDVGWYSAADTLTGSLLFPTTILMGAIFPTFGRLYAQDKAAFEDLVANSFAVLLMVAVPIGFGAMAVASSFSTMLYGEEFDGTGPALAIMSVMTVFTFGTVLFAYAAFAIRRELFVAVLISIAAFLTIPLDMVLIPWAESRYDNAAIGGALSYVITEGFQFFVGLFVIVPFLITRVMFWKTIRILAAGAVMTAAVWPIRAQFVLIPAIVGSVVYVLLIIGLRVLDPHERELLNDAVRRVGRKRHGTTT
jgi:O-antigen/teichoic acid export membrane protein